MKIWRVLSTVERYALLKHNEVNMNNVEQLSVRALMSTNKVMTVQPEPGMFGRAPMHGTYM